MKKWSRNTALEILLNTCTKDKYKNIHSSTVSNSKSQETTQGAINKTVDE